MGSPKDKTILNRRKFLITSSQLALGIMVSSPLNTFGTSFQEEQLSFYHTHTREKLTVCYKPSLCADGIQEQINLFLRDFRTGEVHPMDTALLNTLYCIQRNCRRPGIFEVISGFRSPETNQYLRKTSSGVAKKSLHMKGQAIDVRLSDLPTRKLRDIAITLGHGGVGYYAKSDFVHLDTGHFRIW